MNAHHHTTLTGLATATPAASSTTTSPAPRPAAAFGLIVAAAAGGALGSPAAPGTLRISATGLATISQPWPRQILHPAFDTASRWKPRRHRPPLGRQRCAAKEVTHVEAP